MWVRCQYFHFTIGSHPYRVFQANAHALPHLSGEERRLLHSGKDGASGKLATVGPGTGLGGATLEWAAGLPHACPCEPGAADKALVLAERRAHRDAAGPSPARHGDHGSPGRRVERRFEGRH